MQKLRLLALFSVVIAMIAPVFAQTPTAPVIVALSSSQTIVDGTNVTLSVSVNGTTPFSYQWRKDGNAITGATANLLSFTPAHAADAGSYTVVITNAVGSATSGTIVLSVTAPVAPSISYSPSSTSVYVGSSFGMSCGFSGSGPLTVEWKRNGVVIPGATSTSYSKSNVQLSDAGSYTATATNAVGSVTTAAATVTVQPLTAPVISYTSGDATVDTASYFSLSVSVNNGGSQESYQWYLNGVAVLGYTNSSFTKNSAVAADAGSYTVTVTNAIGSVTSAAMRITVRAATGPVVSIGSGSITTVVSAGNTFSLSSNVSGTPPFTYQWAKDGLPLVGEVRTGLSRVGALSDAGVYTLAVTNAQATTTSTPMHVTVRSPRAPEILTHPVSIQVFQGDDFNLSAGASGTGPITYQWRKDGAVIASQTGNYFSLPSRRAASSDEGSYTVVVSNPYGSVVSEPALVTVRSVAAPVISAPPADLNLTQGTSYSVDLRVTSQSGQVTYEWRRGTVLISSSSYFYGSGQASEAGDYTVKVTNAGGSATASFKIAFSPPPAPEIIADPASGSVLPSDSFSGLSVGLADSSSNYSIQWYRNNVALPASGSGYTNLYLSGSDPTSAGTYKVVVTNASGSATSRDAVVTVDPTTARPAITYTSGSAVVTGGTQWSIQIVTSVTSTIQWQKDGVNIPNATGRSYGFSSFGSGDAATYTAVVTSTAGVVTSRPIVLALRKAGVVPKIVTAPVPVTRSVGDSTSLSVTADGESPLAYQWRKDGVVIPGATRSSYDLSSLVASHAGKYTVTVTNRLGSVVSAETALTMLPETLPVIQSHPMSQTISVGSFSSFSLSVSLFTPVVATYQWQKDGVPISGATSSSYYSSTVSAALAGRYAVVATNGVGSVRSYDAVIVLGNAVGTPPTFAGPALADQSASLSATVTFSSGLTGATAYQWRRNGVDLAGATRETLVLSNIQASDGGTYVVIGSNKDGATGGQIGSLTVKPLSPGLPFIGTQPGPITVLPGNTGTITAGVAANPAATYQWRFNGTPITGATNSTLTLSNVQATAAGRYSLVATNSFGSVTSADAILTLGTPIAFTASPRSQDVPVGQSLTLSATIQGTGSVTYQWKKNGVAISGATSSTLTFSTLRPGDGGTYTVVVSNADGSIESSPATLTIVSSPFAGAYYGSFGSGDSFALYVTTEGSGTFLGVLTPFNEAIVGRSFALAADGSFSFGGTAARAYGANRVSGDLVTGKITGSTVTGRIAARDAAFSGGLLTAGATPSLAGYFQGVPILTMVGEVHAIAGSDGTVLVLAIDPTGVRLARGQLGGSGSFVATQAPFTFNGSLGTPAGAFAGTFQFAGSPSVSFATAPVAGGIERLANVSARGVAGTGGRTMIAGFVVTGTQPKDVLIRAVGPALTSFGVTGALANPRLKLYKDSVSLLENDDWSLGGFASQISTTTTRVGGFPFASSSLDAALLAHLDPGSYSAQVSGANDTPGVALVEVYDAGDTPGPARLINLSTRGDVGTGGDILIVGVVVTGNAPKKILIRGVGPGLAAFGVAGTLVDPQLKLYQGNQLLRENDNWSSGGDATLISDAATAVGAFALPAGSKDSALLINLPPGSYSAQLSGVNSTTGVGLVEVYEVP